MFTQLLIGFWILVFSALHQCFARDAMLRVRICDDSAMLDNQYIELRRKDVPAVVVAEEQLLVECQQVTTPRAWLCPITLTDNSCQDACTLDWNNRNDGATICLSNVKLDDGSARYNMYVVGGILEVDNQMTATVFMPAMCEDEYPGAEGMQYHPTLPARHMDIVTLSCGAFFAPVSTVELTCDKGEWEIDGDLATCTRKGIQRKPVQRQAIFADSCGSNEIYAIDLG